MKTIYVVLSLSIIFFSLISSANPPLETASNIKPALTQEELAKAVSIEGDYIGDLFKNFSGGLERKLTSLHLLSLRGTADFDPLLGWDNTSFFLHIQATHGKQPTQYIGDVHATSNIEAQADTIKVYEAYIQRSFSNDMFSALFGLYDLNSEFYTNIPSAFFINSSMGVGKELSQTGANGPSIYPTTSLGLRLKMQTSENYLQIAVLDAVAGDPNNPHGTHPVYRSEDGVLLVNEVGWTPTTDDSRKNIGKLAFGIWSYTDRFDSINNIDNLGNPIQDTNHGFYILADYQFKENMYIFLRYGQAAEEVNAFKYNIVGGLYAQGFLEVRPNDEIGVAFSKAHVSNNYRDLQNTNNLPSKQHETVYELSYNVYVNEHFSIQPDLQYLANPGTDPSIDDSLSGILRVKLSF